MQHFVYIIQSDKNRKYYVGSSHDPQLRLEHHNAGWTRSTKGKGLWKIVHIESFSSKTEALRRERQIKKMKSRRYIENLVHAEGRPDLLSRPDKIGASAPLH